MGTSSPYSRPNHRRSQQQKLKLKGLNAEMECVGEYEYNTKDLIGHGAFAVVFKGRHKKNHGMVVAIKSITKKNLSKSQNLLGKEIKILKELTELHHENVVALLDCKETPHHVYLVMEYCNGGDLADYLHAKGTLSEDTIRLFLRQLAGAMKALNAKGIVHRDLKPQNILLCHAINKPNPPPCETKLKIADFGFARFLQDGVMAATLCGSPMYMAPEVIMSLQYDAKADLWSIGTIVFQCLTGKAPFQAQTPQALKQFYEKNANLSPKIPSGTSSELTDLLVRLLKRNAKDRMEFDEFFNHPFHKKTIRATSPVPVPTRQRSLSQEPSPSRTMGSPLLSHLGRTPTEEELMNDEPCQEVPIATSPPEPSPFLPDPKFQGSPMSAEEQEDFVLVPPNLPSDNSCDSGTNGTNRRRSLDICGTSPGAMGTSPPRASFVLTNAAPTGVTYYVGAQRSPQASPPLSSSPRPTFLPVTSPPNAKPHVPSSEPIPVPSQKEAYQQIQQSLRESPTREHSLPSTSPSPSPRSPKVVIPHSQPIAVCRTSSTDTMFKTATDVSSLSPPSVQFIIGTPPAGGRRRSSSGGSMGTPPPSTVWAASPSSHASGRQTPTNSPVRRSVGFGSALSNQNYLLGATYLSPILGSPTQLMATDLNMDTTSNSNNPHPLMMPFGTRAQTLPDINSKDYMGNATASRNQMEACVGESLFPKSGSMGRLADPFVSIGLKAAFGGSPGSQNPGSIMMPYGRSSPYLFGREGGPQFGSGAPGFCHGSSPTGASSLAFGTSPPNMEGPIMFIAPDLPEETLMEREHNETLAKLNFVLALVDCILELARSRSSPISALTDSMLRRDNSEDQISVVSEGHRRAEQLVLYVRALQMLSSSLNLSREGLRTGKLQPSTSVKNVVSCMNERYHRCLHMCKLLNTQGLLSSIGMDPNSSNITADRLIYSYAIEMCQSAALDELFGNPQECFRRYQTAQILLHSLSQQVNSDDDRALLSKYKEAVEKRLYVLQQQGYIYAYDTT